MNCIFYKEKCICSSAQLAGFLAPELHVVLVLPTSAEPLPAPHSAVLVLVLAVAVGGLALSTGLGYNSNFHI